MKVLNLYAGIGGNRKLWTKENTGIDLEITAVEYDEKIAGIYQDFFPNDKVIVDDAHQYLLEYYKEFDFIWASPPCPTHSVLKSMGVWAGNINAEYPDMRLYQEIILLKKFSKGLWCIENVRPYYKPLIPPTFELHRHFFWSNFYAMKFKIKDDRIHTEIGKNGDLDLYGFNLIKYGEVGDKRKMLRNMVNPDAALHIIKSAINSTNNKEPKLDI